MTVVERTDRPTTHNVARIGGVAWRARIAAVLAEVAAAHGVSVAAITGRGKPRGAGNLLAARTEAVTRLYYERRLTIRQIGEFLGGREWSTIWGYFSGGHEFRRAAKRQAKLRMKGLL